VLRLPDVYTRLSAASTAATLGVPCILLAGAVHFHDAGVSARALVTVAFVFHGAGRGPHDRRRGRRHARAALVRHRRRRAGRRSGARLPGAACSSAGC